MRNSCIQGSTCIASNWCCSAYRQDGIWSGLMGNGLPMVCSIYDQLIYDRAFICSSKILLASKGLDSDSFFAAIKA